MIYLAYISFAFVCFQFINVLINFFWKETLSETNKKFTDKVSILIPMRNEMNNIDSLFTNLQKLEYPYYEIIVCNDNSDDGTEDRLIYWTQKFNSLRYFNGNPLKDNWRGKNFACYQLAKKASGDFYLFIDADVLLESDTISKVISFQKEKRVELVSIFPKQNMIGVGEKLCVPIMNFILLTLLPLLLVRKSPFTSHAAANGQFMFFKSDTYQRLLPHKYARNSVVEDIQIARYYKKNDSRVACLLGNKDVNCRMYNSYTSAINGFSKNIFMFFGSSVLFAFFYVFNMLFGALVQQHVAITLFYPFILIQVIIIILISALSRQSILMNVLLFIPQQITLGYMLLKSLIDRNKKQLIWKGRNIS